MANREKHRKRSGYSYARDASLFSWWQTNSGRWAGIASRRRKAMKGGQ